LSYVALHRTRCCSVRLSPCLAGGTGGGSPRGGSSRSSVEGAQVDEAVGVLLPAHKEASDQIPPRVRHSAVDPLLKSRRALARHPPREVAVQLDDRGSHQVTRNRTSARSSRHWTSRGGSGGWSFRLRQGPAGGTHRGRGPGRKRQKLGGAAAPRCSQRTGTLGGGSPRRSARWHRLLSRKQTVGVCAQRRSWSSVNPAGGGRAGGNRARPQLYLAPRRLPIPWRWRPVGPSGVPRCLRSAR